MTAAGGDASFADLAVKIVTSRQFRNRAGDDREPAESTGPASVRPANQPPQLITGVR
jgi:hypothetical protein